MLIRENGWAEARRQEGASGCRGLKSAKQLEEDGGWMNESWPACVHVCVLL